MTFANQRKIAAIVVGAASVTIAGAAWAGTYTLIPSYVSPGTSTAVLSVNDLGQMTGNITNTDGSGEAFVRSAGGGYTLFSNGSDFDTVGRNINNAGQITGYSTDSTQNLVTDREFQRSPGGAITQLSDPGTGVPLHGIPQGQNSAGANVGDYYFTSGGHLFVHGYLLNGSTFTDISLGGAFNDRTHARGLNDSGEIVGWSTFAGANSVGFVDLGGVFTSVSDPLAAGNGTYLEGLNNSGLASGEWLDGAGLLHAFIYDTTSGHFTELNPPVGNNFEAFGINSQGEVVLTNGEVNYLYNPAGVPEPAGWAMMLTGVAGAGAVIRRRRRAGLKTTY